MKYLPVILILFLSSCMTSEKAKNYLSAHREDAAGFCADQFPVKSDSIVTIIHDTITEKKIEKDLSSFADSIITQAYNDKNGQITAMEDYIEALEKSKSVTEKDAAGLRNQLSKIKPVDTSAINKAVREKLSETIKACDEKTIKVTQENTARVEQYRLTSERLQKEKDKAVDRGDFWKKWFFILAGVVILYTGLKVLGSKIGGIFKLIP